MMVECTQYCDEYAYLHTIQLGKSNFEVNCRIRLLWAALGKLRDIFSTYSEEVNRRIKLGWAAIRKLRAIYLSKTPQCLKTKVFEQCVLPV
uniref:Endonuclease-reverse transcriptase n=1 Tax=Pararge aegeria TaxID=116150 RepID=S4NT25_9NEOP